MIEERNAVRALLLTPDLHILLMRIRAPNSDRHFWIAPGGGLKPGEDFESGLRRELQEELGLLDIEIGPLVWRRHHTFNWGERRIAQEEEYRVVHVERFEPHISDATEAATLDRFHWWPVSALANCTEPMAPTSLATIVADYLAHGAPTGPLEIERLVD